MADFYKFAATLLKHEGGFVDDPDDLGGATNKGVTLRTFQGVAKPILGVEPTLENLKALTDEQALKIYKARYWDKIRGDEFELQELADIVFDFYVNAGANASKLLQATLNDMGAEIGVDGGIGPATMAALKMRDQIEVYRLYKEGRANYYHRLVRRIPSQKKFLKGWLNRVNSFPDL
ncbi:MAG: glycosyl hydrolase 108 family protein [Pseudomonadota bacterium]